MSSFGGKRKARKIQVNDDEDETTPSPPTIEPNATAEQKPVTTSHTRSKPFKKSALRHSIAFDDEQSQDTSGTDGGSEPKPIREVDFGSSGTGSLSSRPGGKRAGQAKKKPAASRLSFGPGEIISGDDAAALEEDESFTPKKTAPRRGIEANNLRLSLPAYQRGREGEEEERPTYSKDYLEELKMSTQSTPKDLQKLSTEEDGEEGLDASELEGATVVEPSGELLSRRDEDKAYIPTEAEIAEKKQRRARRAQEQDFISLDDGGDMSQIGPISLLPTRKKETRLVRDDEDVMEGFEDFVDDGRISLDKKAQRKAQRQQKKIIAQAIQEAEGSSSEESDDSEAERRADYEAAQTRAGMDGLKKLDATQAAALVPPKVTPIPSLSECLARLRTSLSEAEQESTKRSWRMGELVREKAEIIAREQEVQRLLREAGERYSALRGDMNLPPVDTADPMAFPSVGDGIREAMSRNSGLESFGNTPVGSSGVEDAE
ncbi:hypothetical protein V493_05183 [Pseudogymnoascus sp. VKM F-4281 (FW-2241)]|nr:hypothetical protein V493_05183 [Pseudogymnoascus sp. VKM F-4281 (FW-2241)]